MNPLPEIPWLVQGRAAATPDSVPLTPHWDTVVARRSMDAATTWATRTGLANLALPFRVYVGPAAPILQHPNGQPKIVRSFLATSDTLCKPPTT